MKISLFLVLFLPYVSCATDKQVYNKKNPLPTHEESECWLLYDAYVEPRINALKSLSPRDQNVISRKEQGDLKAAYTNWADKFFILNQQPMPAKYNTLFLVSILLKMSNAIADQSIEESTDKPTARLLVYSKILTPEQRRLLHSDAYKSDPAKTYGVLEILARLTVNEFVKLGIVKNDPEAIQKAEREFLAHKKLEYQLAYD